MRLKNNLTGDVLSVPPPGPLGDSVVLLNGQVVERVLYSDNGDGLITLGNGMTFPRGDGFPEYLVGRLYEPGGWLEKP